MLTIEPGVFRPCFFEAAPRSVPGTTMEENADAVFLDFHWMMVHRRPI
jgi:hypothetical protein